MASSATGTFYTSFANIRMPEGHYLILEFDYDYDDNGNPFIIEVRDGTGTEITNPDPNIITEIIKEIPEFEGQPRAGLWFRNGVNSLSPIQNKQTNNIFLGFETAENFDLTDLVTYSGDYNFLAGGQLGQNLTTGSYNSIFGGSNLSALTTGNYNTIFGFGNSELITDASESFISGFDNVSLATSLLRSFVNGRTNAINTTSLRYAFINGQDNGSGIATILWYSFLNGLDNLEAASNGSYVFANGFSNLKNVTNPNYSFANGLSNLGSGSSVSAQYSFFNGRDNALNSAGSVNYSFLNGHDNLRSGIGIDYGFLSGYRNLYQTTSDIQNTIAIGRENGYSATADHSNSIYLGYRNAYNGSGNYNNYIGYESGYHQTGASNIGIGYRALYGQSGLSTGGYNIAIGEQAGLNLTTGIDNVFISNFTGSDVTDGSYNVIIGDRAGDGYNGDNAVFVGRETGQGNSGNNNFGLGFRSTRYKSGGSNIGIGAYALSAGGGSGYDNVALGQFSLYDLTNGHNNIGLGAYALANVTTGNYNVALGRQAGNGILTGSYNVFLGYAAGGSETGSNKLYIENSSSATPLIYGDFSTDYIRINGYLEVRDKTGTSGNVAAWDTDKLIDSGVSLSSLSQTLSYTDSTNTVTISGSGSSIQLTGLAEEMVLTDNLGNAPYTYRAVDVLGTALGDPLIIAEGTDIGIVRAGNTLTFSYTGSASAQTLSYTEVSKSINLTGSPSIQLDGLVDDMQVTGSGSNYFVTLYDVDNTIVGTQLQLTAGTGMTISRIGGQLTFSASGSSLWTDTTSYGFDNIQANNLSSFKIYDTGLVGIGLTSYPSAFLHVNGSIRTNNDFEVGDDINFLSSGGNINDTASNLGAKGETLAHNGTGVVWFDKGIAWGYRTTTNTTSTTFTTLFLSNGTSSYGNITDTSSSIFTVNSGGVYRITCSGDNQSGVACEIAVFQNSIQSYTINIGAGNQAFSFHDIQALASGTTVGLRFRSTTGASVSVDDVVFSVECIRLN